MDVTLVRIKYESSNPDWFPQIKKEVDKLAQIQTKAVMLLCSKYRNTDFPTPMARLVIVDFADIVKFTSFAYFRC